MYMCIKRKLYFIYSKPYTNTSMDLRFSDRGAVGLPVQCCHGLMELKDIRSPLSASYMSLLAMQLLLCCIFVRIYTVSVRKVAKTQI